MILGGGAGDHDERLFANPARFDVARQPSPHLTFACGPRCPSRRLAMPHEEVAAATIAGGPTALPVSW